MKPLNEVIEDAERCLLPFPGDCLNCPHYDDAVDPNTCMTKIISDALDQLKMYRSDKAQYEIDREQWETAGAEARKAYEEARDKHIQALKELKEKTGTATAPWNPDRNRYCCDQCGAYIGKYDKYCNGCGARLTDWTPDGRGKRK